MTPVYADLHTLTNLILVNMLISGVLVILVLWALIYVIKFANSLEETLGSNLLAGEHQDFINRAQNLEDAGKYAELFELADERSKTNIGDLNGKWFRGVSLFRMQRYGEALQEFSDLHETDSAWNRETVEGYIKEIREKMDGPKKSTT